MNSENRSRSSLGPLPRRSALLAGGTIASLVLTLVGITSPALAASQSGMASDGVSVAGPSGGDDCTVVTSQGKSVRVGGDDDRCRGDKGDKGDRGDRGPRGPRGETGPKGDTGPCNDIDTYNPAFPAAYIEVPTLYTHQFTGALFDPDGATGPAPTEAWAGIRTVPGGDYVWEEISANGVAPNAFPADACSISVADNGTYPGRTEASVQVLTFTGVVWETTCDLTPAVGIPPAIPGDPDLTCDPAGWTRVTPSPADET